MKWPRISALLFLLTGPSGIPVAQSFAPRLTSNRRLLTTPQYAAEDFTKEVSSNASTEAVNGDASGIILQADAKSQLFASFAALSLSDQYDAVLTGLCAKILDSAELTDEQAATALEDPLQLMEEMNAKRIPASARSLMALVDVRNGRVSSFLDRTCAVDDGH